MIEWLPSSRVLVSIGPFTLYWYGLLYVVAFAVTAVLLPRLARYRGFTCTAWQSLELVTWGALGAVVGGRLGYVLLYEPAYYVNNLSEIFQLSQGGMSSHGGFVGVVLVILLRGLSGPCTPTGGPVGPAAGDPRSGHPLFSLFDVVVVPASLGLALGRLGNLINHELYITAVAQVAAVAFPLLIAAICYVYLRRSERSGAVTGLFLVLYSLARFIEEFLREPEWLLVGGSFTWGQVYTLPLLGVGLYLLRNEVRHRHP